jgi:hypothetical protein
MPDIGMVSVVVSGIVALRVPLLVQRIDAGRRADAFEGRERT